MINRTDLYPVVDRPPLAALEAAGLRPVTGPHYIAQHWRNTIKARWTGEKRQPKKGEFYLSGSEIEAYRAHMDMSDAYHIAELVHVGPPVVTEVVLGVLPLTEAQATTDPACGGTCRVHRHNHSSTLPCRRF